MPAIPGTCGRGASRPRAARVWLLVCLGFARSAHAQAVEARPAASSAPAPAPQAQPPEAPERRVSLEPEVAEAKPPGRAKFDVDPIADTSLVIVSFAFSFVLEAINSTGEIRPQQIEPDFDRDNLIGIDRDSITSNPDPNAGARSNVGLAAAAAFAIIDPVLSGFREQSVQTSVVDAMLYAESVGVTFALTNTIKLAVRRPRPRAYIDAERNRDDPSYANSSTDSALSFFSGHASVTAAVGATASYLAFTRSPSGIRPWLTLALATGITTFVAVERVRAGKHFPTDVLAGAVAGAGIGVIVPHLHRTEDVKQRRVWVGFAPVSPEDGARGGGLHVSGHF